VKTLSGLHQLDFERDCGSCGKRWNRIRSPPLYPIELGLTAVTVWLASGVHPSGSGTG